MTSLMDKERIRAILAETARRKREALRVFRPLDYQTPFFMSKASEVLLRGGNRSGKTLCAAMEVGSAVTGTQLHDHNNNPIPFKYPTDRPLLVWLIGYGEDHIGDTFHRMLFRRNPEMKMIRDLETGEWRNYQPWNPDDCFRDEETRMAPPIIPPRMIAEWGWKDKSRRHFKVCRLHNGTQIHAFTSKGEPKMGDPVDLIWIDERILRSRHYPEWQARISDRKGRIIWSLWPGNANPAVYDLIGRAEQEQERCPENPDVEEIRLKFSDNPFIEEETKAKRIRGWSDEERRSRDEGELISGEQRIYPTFNTYVHGSPVGAGGMDDAVDKAITNNGGEIPPTWRKDLIVDPGHSHPGFLLVATPPPSIAKGARVGVVFGELYLPNSDAFMQAKAYHDYYGTIPIQSMIIDAHAARTTPMGFGQTVGQQYVKAFAHYNIRCVETGAYFTHGSDDIMAGIGNVREMLNVGSSGRPHLRVLAHKCPNFVQQMTTYTKSVNADGISEEKPAGRQVDPLCDCIRYWATSSLPYRQPPASNQKGSPAYELFISEWKEKPKDQSVYLGAGSSVNQGVAQTWPS